MTTMRPACTALLFLAIIASMRSLERYCNGTGDANRIAGAFTSLGRDGTNCPSEKWLELFKNSDMRNGSKTGYKIMNIGFNKGYNFATWLNVFAPSTKVDVPRWSTALGRIPSIRNHCGACNDCQAPPIVSPHAGQSNPYIHIIGVDLNDANIRTVNSVMAHLNKTNNLSRINLELVHAAAGSPNKEPGVNSLRVPKCMLGNELCRIPDDPSRLDASLDFVDVPLVSIDGLVRKMHFIKSPQYRRHNESSSEGEGLPRHKRDSTDVIDILHIDTEGNDAEVLKGSTHLLKSHKIRALMFEYHHFLPWGNIKLSDVVKTIDTYDMECFFCGRGRLWPISNECWDELYEFHRWSNVMCVLRTDPWLQAVNPLVQTGEVVRTRTGNVPPDARKETPMTRSIVQHKLANQNSFLKRKSTGKIS